MTERRLTAAAPSRSTAVEPGHLGTGAGLVDEDELVGIDKAVAARQTRRRAATSGRSCSAAWRVFVNDSPSRATADHIAPTKRAVPRARRAAGACNAAKVRSGWAVDVRRQRGLLRLASACHRPVTASRAGAYLTGAATADQRLVDVRLADPKHPRRRSSPPLPPRQPPPAPAHADPPNSSVPAAKPSLPPTSCGWDSESHFLWSWNSPSQRFQPMWLCSSRLRPVGFSLALTR